jgi:hypothetical protein
MTEEASFTMMLSRTRVLTTPAFNEHDFLTNLTGRCTHGDRLDDAASCTFSKNVSFPALKLDAQLKGEPIGDVLRDERSHLINSVAFCLNGVNNTRLTLRRE